MNYWFEDVNDLYELEFEFLIPVIEWQNVDLDNDGFDHD